MTITTKVASQEGTVEMPTSADRCDNPECNAAARFVATLTGGNTLMFCLHHGKEHEPKLAALAANIQKFPY